MAVEAADDEEKVASEQVVFWKNASLMYDACFSRKLEWPSLTVEWLPGTTRTEPLTEGWKRHQLVIGTHTDRTKENELLLVAVDLPSAETEIDARGEDFGLDTSVADATLSMAHPGGESNRVRHCPQEPTLLASKCANGLVYVFDIEKAAAAAAAKGGDAPGGGPLVATLRDHEDEGYGVAWDPRRKGKLLSAGYDGSLIMFDVEKEMVEFKSTGNHGGGVVGDCAFAQKRDHVFGSCGDDGRVLLWDDRTRDVAQVLHDAHDGDINSLSFASKEAVVDDPFFVTGSADKTVKLWDMRKAAASREGSSTSTKKATPLHVASTAGDTVVVTWAPFGRAFVAAASARRVSVFDFTKIGADASDVSNAKGIDDDDESNDTPPELVVDHAGHKAKLNDVSWNLSEDMLAASVAEDNSLQVWWLASALYEDDDESDDAENDDDKKKHNKEYDFFDTLPLSKEEELPRKADDDQPSAKRAKAK